MSNQALTLTESDLAHILGERSRKEIFRDLVEATSEGIFDDFRDILVMGADNSADFDPELSRRFEHVAEKLDELATYARSRSEKINEPAK